jgi:Methyltransferase FkbM domain
VKALPESVKKPLRLWLERLGACPKRSFGLGGLDVRLAQYLTIRRGFFVEVGANDGVSQSNTAYYERYLGWQGILIEPVPELAARCRMNRPNAIVEQCALVPFNYSGSTIEMTYCNLMSLVSGARGSREGDDAHLAVGRQHLATGDSEYQIRVPTRNLTEYLILTI